MRGLPATALALLLATQGAQVFAAGRSFGHSGTRGATGAHHFHSHSNVIFRPVRVVPRYVYVAPYVPYYSTPYYSSPSYYAPSAAYAAPAYYPPDPPSYEPPQQYAPPPPPRTPAPQAVQPGPYSMEQGTQYRYLCLDTRRFYPDTKECASGWLTVLPGARDPAR